MLLIALLPLTGTLLRRLRLLRKNYRGDFIPSGYGLAIVLWSGAALTALLLQMHGHRREPAAYLAVVTGFGVLGFVDDLFGSRDATGLRGHFRRLLREHRVTTGLLKALGGVALSVWVARAVLEDPWPLALVSSAVIALSANAMNLLDLRPGRACAAFLVLGAVLLIMRWRQTGALVPLVYVVVPALPVYERDARGRVMLGDTGSNPLGAALGLALVLALPGLASRLGAAATLLAIHVAAERWSLTALIEANPTLRRLDRLTGIR